MKKISTIMLTTFFTLLSFGLIFSACKDKCDSLYCLNGGSCIDGECVCPADYYGEHCEEEVGGGSGGGNGQGEVVFWIDDDYGCGQISVNVDGVSRSISKYFSSAPNCGTDGCATYTLDPGTYNYTASCGSLNWNSSITIEEGVCLAYHLKSNGSGGGNGGGGGGGNGGGGGGGGSQTGQVVFWTDEDYSCGNISVTCNGVTRSISGYYSNGVPDCGASSCATFSLPVGTYSFSAECDTYNWSGTVTISEDYCYKSRLYL